jgi:hypothetical membrane protein
VTTLCNETYIRTTTRDDDRDASRAVAVAGGATWVLAVLQYVAATLVAASAWTSAHYSWLNNSISDLANTACGMFAVPNGTPGYVCSPLQAVMNGAFVLTGVLVSVGALLLWRTWPSSWLNDTALVLLVIMGLGKILVGFAPENTDIGLHLMGSLNVPLGSIAVLLLSLVMRRTDPGLSAIGMVLAVVGLVGMVLSTVGQYAGPALYLGLGVGGMERVATYPAPLWLLLAGVITIRRATRSIQAINPTGA